MCVGSLRSLAAALAEGMAELKSGSGHVLFLAVHVCRCWLLCGSLAGPFELEYRVTGRCWHSSFAHEFAAHM